MKQSTKKIIAREVLILFTLLMVGVLLYLFLIGKNFAIKLHEDDLREANNDLQSQISDARKSTILVKTYLDEIQNRMSMVYKVDSDTVLIPARRNSDFRRLYPKAISVYPNTPLYKLDTVRTMITGVKNKPPVPIEYITERELGIKVRLSYPEVNAKISDEELAKEVSIRFLSKPEQRTILYHVELETFLDNMSDEAYQDAVFTFLTERNNEIELLEYNLMVGQLGDINENLKLIEQAEGKIDSNMDSIYNWNKYRFDEYRILPLIKKVLLILLVLIYPIRILAVALLWSIKTLREK